MHTKGSKGTIPFLIDPNRPFYCKPCGREFELLSQAPEICAPKSGRNWSLETVTPRLPQSRLEFIPLSRMKWHNIIVSAGGLVGKGNFRLLFGENHVFHKILKRNEFTVVSPPQLIVDLITEGGHRMEATRLLLDKGE